MYIQANRHFQREIRGKLMCFQRFKGKEIKISV